MNVMLKSFSEDVSLTDPKNPQRFLVFEAEGEEFRVPVSAEAIAAVAKFVFKRQAKVFEPELPPNEEPLEEEQEKEASPEVDPDAEQFGGDVENEEEWPEDDETDVPGQLELRKVPASEEEVPSL